MRSMGDCDTALYFYTKERNDIIFAIMNSISKYYSKPVYNDHLYNKIYYLWFIQ